MQNINWQLIYTAQAPKLLGVCRRYVKDLSTAEDVMHNGFEKAMQKANTLKDAHAVEGWLYRIVVNEALIFIKQNKKLQFDETLLELNLADTSDEDALEDIYTQEELLEALDCLPIHHQTVFNLYVLENYSHQEIAIALEITENTSKSHLHRARLKLKDYLLNKDKKKRRIAGLLIFTNSPMKLDDLFKKSFEDFEIKPQRPLNFISNKPPFWNSNILKWSAFGAVFVAILLLVLDHQTTVFSTHNQSTNKKVFDDQSASTKSQIVSNNEGLSSQSKIEILEKKKNLSIDESSKNVSGKITSEKNALNIIYKNNDSTKEHQAISKTKNKVKTTTISQKHNENQLSHNVKDSKSISKSNRSSQKEKINIKRDEIVAKINEGNVLNQLSQSNKNQNFTYKTDIFPSDTSKHIIVKKTTIRRDTIYVYKE